MQHELGGRGPVVLAHQDGGVIGAEDEGVLVRALLTDAEVVLSEAGSAGDWIGPDQR
jgi:hypothetical protein